MTSRTSSLLHRIVYWRERVDVEMALDSRIQNFHDKIICHKTLSSLEKKVDGRIMTAAGYF